ncbi:ABC transporter related protein [Caldalkalibacillus thermarum TA2.A1]|uniref:ABC transporter related protein n=1 Tax=Caldalkalibacillus thermarum (strain TA2.A1) TaxID=986075 RepID=F5L5J7_CALTT|nr:ABC transporter ATP-binding protein [Caldalkalibacillus thermarum]EGL83395.1 ABC transporter related protein [Caldalkalibacillus thermarum TA2.A1]QZT34533.1 energy-coupling factor ABC transporter ATP-binding protein [Caldalkalibacillus thermarum TA2.A1]
MFALKNVRYKDILHIHELTIPAQQVTCIIGESGSGKSTLFKLLNHLLSADAGQIIYKGKPVELWDPVRLRREVIMVPQDPVVFRDTIREDLLAGLEFTEQPPATDDTLQHMLELVHLPKQLDDEVFNLSGGEKQRLSLARALLINPEVLLLDEPTSALDEKTEDMVMSHIVDYVKSQGKTLAMITHSKRVAEQFADRLLELKNGDVTLIKE